ncbi:MAG: CAP domain-containing protein [Parvibaculum sp.]|nr:CAP domain-containing protein [Parvibaculum sp.]
MDLALRIVSLAGLALLLAACASGPAYVPPPAAISVSSVPQAASAAASEDAYSRAILQAVNTERSGRGIAPLGFSSQLQRAAAIHSADMAARGFVGDFNPDAQGPDERVKAVWPEFKGSVGENISVNEGVLANESSTSPDVLAAAIVQRWAATLQMRKNMRNAAFTLGGIGITRSGDKIFVTGVFAAP